MNGIDDNRGEIPILSLAKASKVPKITLNKVVSLMNNRASIAMSQRASRKRRQRKRVNQAITESSGTEDIIEVDEPGGPTRRRRIESPNLASSPSLRVVTGRYGRGVRGQGQ